MLLAIENAPPGQRAGSGMFPSSAHRSDSFFTTTVFLALAAALGDDQFLSYGWRLPFLASARARACSGCTSD